MSAVEPIKDKKSIAKIEKDLLKTNYRNYALFCLGINSGLRISDILNLNVEDVKDKNFIQITEQKTGKFKKFPLNSKIKKIIQIMTKNRTQQEPLFKTKYNKRMNRFAAYEIIKNACSKLEINAGTHTLRKTFGYHHYKKFKDIVLLQKIFNHSNSATTLRYIGIEQDEINFSYMNFIL
ncbi:tyrosine-type recombinase/integrase [bacterium]|nr:tyrosine-type recombinase/integrase [bacterium]